MANLENLSFHDVLRWSDDECRAFLVAVRWGGDPICPKCGGNEPYTITRRSRNKNRLTKLFKCRDCRRQFSATVGTIFEDSKIPLHKWFAAFFLMCSSKKGISAHQLHRMLGISYRAAWFMSHRIRNAMTERDGELFSGEVEVDETFVGPRTRRGHPIWHEVRKDELRSQGEKVEPPGARDRKKPVFGIIERGGRVKTEMVDRVDKRTLLPILLGSIEAKNTKVFSDGHSAYRALGRHVPHEVVDHNREYVRGDAYTQNIENHWSIFKRGLVGTFHHIGEDYLPMYLLEFDFRANTRKLSDVQRFVALMRQTQGRLLWYCKTPQPENPYA